MVEGRCAAKSSSMKIGFHIPFSGNLKRLTGRVVFTRGNCFQFYSRSLKGGRIPEVNENQLRAYLNFLFEKRISTVIVHAPYVFKVQGKDISSNLGVKSSEAVIETLKDLEYASKVQARYYVINAGYSKELNEFLSMETLKEQLTEIMDKTSWKGTILIRNMAGGGTELAANLYSWNELISFHERVQGALDFGRAFSYGYSFLIKEEADALLDMIEHDIGWDKVPLIYINDTNRFSGSKREDAASLGEGVIGFHGYNNLLSSESLKDKVWMVEHQTDVHYDKTIDFLVNFYRKNPKDMFF